MANRWWAQQVGLQGVENSSSSSSLNFEEIRSRNLHEQQHYSISLPVEYDVIIILMKAKERTCMSLEEYDLQKHQTVSKEAVHLVP